MPSGGAYMRGYGGIGSRTLRPSRNPATAASSASTANTIAAGSERPNTGSNLKVHGSVCWPGDGTSTCVWMVTGVFGSRAPVFTVTVRPSTVALHPPVLLTPIAHFVSAGLPGSVTVRLLRVIGIRQPLGIRFQ